MRGEYCGRIGRRRVGERLCVCGWVRRWRDHGGVIFIDLRDESGSVQIVASPDQPAVLAIAHKLRGEYVIRASGPVRERPAGAENPALASGEVEIVAEEIEILNPARPAPFSPADPPPSEEVRLSHRVVDLRRDSMQRNLRLRHKAAKAVRDFLDGRGFVEIETPLLTRSTPEGARDFLVPSRVAAGHFYALPQSPQLFKQMLVAGGFERYYQIARCFRDEDLRADRQPEFTQIDIELAFADEETVMNLTEEMMRAVFRVAEIELPDPFPRLTFAEATARYGSDRPDLRAAMELVDVGDLMREADFRVFREPACSPDGRVAALRLPGGANLTRREIDDLAAFAATYGAKGLAYIKVEENGEPAAPILKFLPDETVAQTLARVGAEAGDIVFFGADKAEIVAESLGAVRLKIAAERGLIKDEWRPLWVTEFPLFVRDERGALAACHHPFTAAADFAELDHNPAAARARAYDLVVNGRELGGGSARIHRAADQLRMLAALGIDEKTARAKFGFLLDALAAGAPPHAGVALGLDRIAAMLAGGESIREVIAFPKTQTGHCPVTDAPAPADPAQLKELALAVAKPKKPAV